MIVSNTETVALDCVALEVGAGPTPGISPAKAVPERTHENVSASNNRFMDFSPLSLRRCKTSYIKMSRTRTKIPCKEAGR
jgi:hypothetical protein